VLKTTTTMTTTTTTPKSIIEVTEGVMAGDVFYGLFDTRIDGKRITVMVSNFLKDTTNEYEFRVAGKCQAGFISIHDTKGTPHSIIKVTRKTPWLTSKLRFLTKTELNNGTTYSLPKVVSGTGLTKGSWK
jgi:hypothetical protein